MKTPEQQAKEDFDKNDGEFRNMKTQNSPHVTSSRKECDKLPICLETSGTDKYAGSADNIPSIKQEIERLKSIISEQANILGRRDITIQDLRDERDILISEKKQALTSEIKFLESCFLNKSLLCSIDGLAEKLDGDELILIHKLVDMANEQNKSVILRIAESSRMLRILDGVQKPKVSDVKGALSE